MLSLRHRQEEEETRRIGSEMLDRAARAEPSVIRPDHWLTRLLDWATADPRRKCQLFRFVDVLPTLTTDEAMIQHLADYLLRDGVPLPGPFRKMLQAASEGAWFRAGLAAATRSNAMQMAGRFIAGRTPQEARDVILKLRRHKMAFTLDVLGEATLSGAEADRYADRYMDLMSALAREAPEWEPVEIIDRGAGGHLPRVNLSLKLSSLEPHFDPISPERGIGRLFERLRPLVREARRLGVFLNVDMEQYYYKDLTLAAFCRLLDEPDFRDFTDIGIVLQAYLRDTPRDLDALIEWARRRAAPITVRLVRGAYWDYEVSRAIQNGWPIPVLTQKWQTDARFEVLARRLLDQHQLIRPALGSHNIRSLAAAMAHARVTDTPPRAFEVQMLFGMGDPLKRAVVDMGYALRVYTPFGELIPGMAYLIRRLLENSSNESFLKHTFREHRPTEQLLSDPALLRPKSHPLPGVVCTDTDEDTHMKPFAYEPATDFIVAAAREQMKAALEDVAARFGRRYPLVIDGRPIETADIVVSVNPSLTTQVVGTICLADRSHVDFAVSAAQAAFQKFWSETKGTDRARLLRNAARIMRRRRFELAAWIVYEAGKPWRESDAEVAEAIDFCNYYAREIEQLEARPRRRDFPGQENHYVYHPRGVVAVIAPWNFPLSILTGMSTAALAAGNTVVMKPAQQASVIAAQFMEVLREAGFPRGVVNFLPGRGDIVGTALVEHPDVGTIAFTGSREVGVHLHEQAARWKPGQSCLKRVIAEMGGKNAIIVDADADLDEAIAGIITSAFGYSGQKCSACSRVIVHQSILSSFVDRLVDAASSVHIGPATDPDVVVGPLIDTVARDKTLRYIEQGKNEGRLVFQADPGQLGRQGTFAPLAIFSDVPPGAHIAQEEIFGPILVVIAAESFDHAIRIANGTEYGLTGGVYSRSPAHIEQAKRTFQVGNLYINQKITGAMVDRQPFGGCKMSGVGTRAGGPDYLIQFMEPKTVCENTLRHGFAPDTVIQQPKATVG